MQTRMIGPLGEPRNVEPPEIEGTVASILGIVQNVWRQQRAKLADYFVSGYGFDAHFDGRQKASQWLLALAERLNDTDLHFQNVIKGQEFADCVRRTVEQSFATGLANVDEISQNFIAGIGTEVPRILPLAVACAQIVGDGVEWQLTANGYESFVVSHLDNKLFGPLVSTARSIDKAPDCRVVSFSELESRLKRNPKQTPAKGASARLRKAVERINCKLADWATPFDGGRWIEEDDGGYRFNRAVQYHHRSTRGRSTDPKTMEESTPGRGQKLPSRRKSRRHRDDGELE